MRLTTLFLTVTLMHAFASGTAQTVSVSGDNLTMERIFSIVEQQTGYVVFGNKDLLSGNKKITLHVKDMPLLALLDTLLKDQPVKYIIADKTIFISPGEKVPVYVRALPITGRILNASGQPLPGATIRIKGSRKGTSTNANGVFNIDVENGDVLVISFLGFKEKEYTIGNDLRPDILLEASDSKLDEAVIVAYGQTTQRTSTGAITVVKREQIERLPSRSIDRSLQGLVPGLQIITGSGLPGGATTAISLRGLATGAKGVARNPLFVVDGVPFSQKNFDYYSDPSSTEGPNAASPTNPLNQINPADVESISVLKDAAAIALYGSQAANGVILVTTRKGKAGRPKVTFQHQTDVSFGRLDNRKILNQHQFLELLYESYRNADPGRWTDQAIFSDLTTKFPYHVTNGDTSFYPAPDWQKEIYQHGLSISNDLSYSGGSDKVVYYLGLGHLTQSGILKNTGFDRYSLRYNLNVKPASWISIGLNANNTYTHQDFAGADDMITESNGFANFASPLLPVRDTAGKYILLYPYGYFGYLNVANPAASQEYNRQTGDAYKLLANAFAEIRFLKYFSFRTNIGIDMLLTKSKRKNDARLDRFGSGGSLTEDNEIRSGFITNNILNFQYAAGHNHNFSLMLAQEAQINKSNLTNAQGTGFSPGFSTDELLSMNTRSGYGYNTKTTAMSYFGKLDYNFRQKYLLSTTYRMDGSSSFGRNVPLKKYWSAGAGWVLSDEHFMKEQSWADFLKLRGSVGVAGNTIAIPTYTRANRVTAVVYSDAMPTYGTSVSMLHGNAYVEPESTFNIDFGLEAQLWKQRINITADIYKRKTNKLVTYIPQPYVNGQNMVHANLGDMENKGIELSLSVDVIRTADLTWTLSGNWSSNDNRLVKSFDSVFVTLDFINKVGETYNSWNLVRWAGVDPATGSPRWLDKDGNITTHFNYDDRVMTGSQQPDGFGSFGTTLRFRNFELQAMFYYIYGHEVINSYLYDMTNDGGANPYNNQSVLALDRWQKPGDIAANPKRILNNTSGSNNLSTRYLMDGSYIRFKNIMLSYHFPHLLKTAGNAEIFVQMNNIATWARSKEMDPDNTGSYGRNDSQYPQQRSASIGLKMNF